MKYSFLAKIEPVILYQIASLFFLLIRYQIADDRQVIPPQTTSDFNHCLLWLSASTFLCQDLQFLNNHHSQTHSDIVVCMWKIFDTQFFNLQTKGKMALLFFVMSNLIEIIC